MLIVSEGTSDEAERPSVPFLLRAFLLVQQQRAEHYAHFHALHKAYLASRNQALFQEGAGLTTAAFASCSQQVRGVTLVTEI